MMQQYVAISLNYIFSVTYKALGCKLVFYTIQLKAISSKTYIYMLKISIFSLNF